MEFFRNRNFKYVKTAILLFIIPLFLNAQNEIESQSQKECSPKTILELFKKKDSLYVVKPTKNDFFLVIPAIGSQPATGFFFGGVAQYTFKGKQENDKYSVANLGILYTVKKQWMINVKNNILLKNNKIFLSGDYRYYIFSQPNYGLGTDIIPPRRDRPDGFSIDSIAQSMDYNYFKFHQTASFEIRKNFYVGGGVNIDWYTNIKDKELDIENGNLTYHYNYSQLHGFDNLEYFLTGVSFNMVYDSRDNQVNSSRGWFANLNYRFNPVLFHNQKYSNVLYAEYRHFVPLSHKNDRYILGIWAYGQFITRGDVPYLNLPAIGWDQRSRGGEGYTQGLFRGNGLVYLSTEFRFPITCNQMFSGTVFTNFVTASNADNNIGLFHSIQPAAGVGFRVLIDKKTRTNLVADYSWGNNSKGFYLNAGEVF
ncbi:outer membrane protein assembly factor BamA [Flavobacterium nitrogenifigens]|uniref:Outer membrane protein assembly factor BamA n=2 Tax=Flavobacterium TaxID=237 RepID=A0A7W7N8X2_9FLAO|nr:BamA/TamA family outer membrane protein [Flavobacterium nitrogenifigens]MBB4802864.1 outer membrane protein assembly factor BamA [Flavobacterium nitrogenifigens]MBB6387822.1 outer membrane protein assembly factor BamA [Flavobacterium notoginsengisoli]